MTSLVATKTHRADVVGLSPPGEAAPGWRGRSLPSGRGRAGL